MSEPITTTYLKIRAEADEDASTINLAANGGGWANRPTSNFLAIPKDGSHQDLAFIFAGGIDADTDPNNKTFSWTLYAWRDQHCPAEYVATGTGILGTQDVVALPDGTAAATSGTDLRNWADTIVVTNDDFLGLVSVTDTGNDRIAKLRVQTKGYRYWYIEITSADGVTGAEAGAISVWYSRF